MELFLFQWHWWAAIAIVLFIAEIFVPGFFLFCLGVGCIGASVAAAITNEPTIQLLAFSGFTLLAFFTLRPVLMKRMWKDNDVRTNVDALVGVTGRVTQDFEPGLRLGRVAAAGDDWPIHGAPEISVRRGRHCGESPQHGGRHPVAPQHDGR